MSYTDARKAIAGQMGSEHTMPCRWCGEQTAIATLTAFGARCGACYAAYCLTPAPKVERSRYARELLAEIERGKA